MSRGPHAGTLGLRPVQVAYHVADPAEAAVRFARDYGWGPFYLMEHIALQEVRHRGAPGQFDHSSAYGQAGEMMVELVREHTAPLVPSPSGLHHMAFMVDSLSTGIDWCAQQGWPLTLHAQTGGGQEFVFCDARHDLGHFIEMYEPSDRLLSFYDHVRQLSLT